MEEIQARMSEVEKQRHPSYVKYLLADILIIVVRGVLCGLDTLDDLVIYAKSKKGFLSKELGIEHIPSKATFARVLSMVEGKQIILSAYLTSSGIILAQESIHEKTNEIPVFQEALTYLDVEGKTITADAMHCQRETCRRIIQRKGDYFFGLKDHQPSL